MKLKGQIIEYKKYKIDWIIMRIIREKELEE